MEKHCPCCKNVKLRRAIRREVEIDYCPDCNGIWLDNGELNKIVTESIQASARESSPAEVLAETSAEASRKSVFKSFLDLMGSTKDDADNGSDDDGLDNNADDDFISEPNE